MAKIAAELDEKKRKEEEKETARKQVSYFRWEDEERLIKEVKIDILDE